MDVSSEMIHSLLPVFMVTVLHASALTVGLVEGAAEALALIVKVFSGVLSDFIGRRKPLALLGYGLAALTKPLFALASGVGTVLAARLIDRVGKGIRGAPRDALIADIVTPELRGAAFGLRQSLDTVGAVLGPALAMALMFLWSNDFRAVFWVAVVPGLMALGLLALGVQEPDKPMNRGERVNPLKRANLKRLPLAYWGVVSFGAVFTLARFSEAFLVLRAQQGGLPLAQIPLVLIAMNVVYAASAYPIGKLADRMDHASLLVMGLLPLVGADALLAWSGDWSWVAPGVLLWGLHMGMTQGLLSAMIAGASPADLRGTAFGLFNLVSGVAMLLASALAGWLWDTLGAPATFLAGAALATLAALTLLPRLRSNARSVG
jgi:MFS family permease